MNSILKNMFIDTHAHLYEEAFDLDRNEMLKKAKKAGVSHIFMPNIDIESLPLMLEVEKLNPNFCFSMLGLHPCQVNKDFKLQLNILYPYLLKHSFCAIGEIGLDFFHDTTFENEQYEAFNIQLEWALEQKLPINIHSRKANDESIKTLKNISNSKDLYGVFHCFSGTSQQAKQLLDMNFKIGIGGVVTFKNAGLVEVLKTVPLSQIVLETDAPYLAPTPFRGKRNESAYLTYVIEKLADIYETTPLEIKKITNENALKSFKIEQKI